MTVHSPTEFLCVYQRPRTNFGPAGYYTRSCDPRLIGMYMGRTMADVRAGLAEINVRRAALNLPTLVLKGCE